MSLFPLFANLAGRRTIVVGGGPVAERKARLLREAGAAIVVVAPVATDGLRQLARRPRLEIIEEVFHETPLDNAWFVVAATNDHGLNQRIAALCGDRKNTRLTSSH